MNSPASRPERLLIVDDEPANLKLLDRMLRSQGYHRLDLVGDPRQVLERYQQDRPDLILLDINMPHPTGWKQRDTRRPRAEPPHRIRDHR